jgi:hypothetical protein
LYELFFLYALGHPYVELTYLLAMLSCLTFSSIAISSKISLYSFPVPSVGCLRFRKRVQKYATSAYQPNVFTSFFRDFLQIAVNQREKFLKIHDATTTSHALFQSMSQARTHSSSVKTIFPQLSHILS